MEPNDWEEYKTSGSTDTIDDWEEYGKSKLSKTGSGTKQDPYKLSGNVDVPEEPGLGYGVIEDALGGAVVGKTVGAAYDLFKGIPLKAAKEPMARAASKLDELMGLHNRPGMSDLDKGVYANKVKDIQSSVLGPKPTGPAMAIASKIPVIGKPIAELGDKFITSQVDKLVSRIPKLGGNAAARVVIRAQEKLMQQGMTREQAMSKIQGMEFDRLYNFSNMPSKAGAVVGAGLPLLKDIGL